MENYILFMAGAGIPKDVLEDIALQMYPQFTKEKCIWYTNNLYVLEELTNKKVFDDILQKILKESVDKWIDFEWLERKYKIPGTDKLIVTDNNGKTRIKSYDRSASVELYKQEISSGIIKLYLVNI